MKTAIEYLNAAFKAVAASRPAVLLNDCIISDISDIILDCDTVEQAYAALNAEMERYTAAVDMNAESRTAHIDRLLCAIIAAGYFMAV